MKSNKFIRKSTLFGTAVGLLSNALNQHSVIQQNPYSRFDWNDFIYTGMKGATLGFGISSSVVLINNIGTSLKEKKALSEFKSETDHLRQVLDTHQTNAIPSSILTKAKSIMNTLECVYEDKLVNPPKFQGSLARKTNIKNHSDIDILLSFKSNSFSSLEKMYEDVYCTLKRHILCLKIKRIRKQSVSLGLVFSYQNQETIIDIVPSRKIDNYLDGSDYSLYKNATKCSNKPSRVKMNPILQKDLGTDSKNKRDVISSLKVFNALYGKPLKGTLIEAFTHRFFNAFQENMPRKLSDKVIMTMDYIARNIESARITAIDNTSTVLTDKLSYSEKKQIAGLMEKTVCELKSDPTYFIKHFRK